MTARDNAVNCERNSIKSQDQSKANNFLTVKRSLKLIIQIMTFQFMTICT